MSAGPAGGADDPPLSVAALWRDTVAVAQRNAELIILLAAAFYFLPQLVASELQPLVGATAQRPSLPLILGVALVGLVAQGAITQVALDDLLGVRRTLGEAVGRAARRLPQLFAANLAAGVAIGLGLVALIAPGLWLLGRLSPVTPVVMAEERDLVAGLERSWALTDGRAWPAAVYMLLLVVLLLSLLFTGALVAAALQAVATIAGGEGLARFLTGVAMAAVAAGAASFLHVAQAVLYRHLLAEAGRRRA